MVAKLVEKLMEFDDFTWGRILLSRDPFFGKLGESEVCAFIQGAHECAEKLVQLVSGNPSSFAESEKITIKIDDSSVTDGYLYFGHYYSKPPTIEISQFALDLNIESAGIDANLYELIIAHEIFHHLEARDTTLFTRNVKVKRPFLGRWMRTYQITKVSEIAAVHFSKLWLELSFCPAVLDILLVQAKSPERAMALAAEQLQRGGNKR